MRYEVRVNGRPVPVEVIEKGDRTLVRVDGREEPAELVRIRGDGAWTLRWRGRTRCVVIGVREDGVAVTVGSREYRVTVEDEREAAAHAVRPPAEDGPRVLRSVMPGIVREVVVEEGAAVAEKAPLLVLEAMKMQNEVRADRAGTVVKIHVKPGTAVAKGDALVTVR